MHFPWNSSLRRLRTAAVTLLILGLGLQAAAAAPGDENWGADFGYPGANGHILASAVHGGQLVVGGYFTSIGGDTFSNLAVWNGVSWSALGASFDQDVTSLVVWNGDLYAGGGFTAAGATSLAGLARWNGSAWVDVGGGVSGTVEDLAVWNNKLVVAGSFEYVDGGSVYATNVAVWNGTSWEVLNDGTDGYVTDVESFGGSLYACGEFTIAGGTGVANLARWSGSAWFSVGGGLTDDTGDPYNAFPNDMAVHAGKLVITGAFLQAGALAVDGIVAWNGTSFSGLGSPAFGGEGIDVGLYGGNLVACDGYGNVKSWNGVFWNSLGYANGTVYTTVELAGVLYVGGAFSTVIGVPARSLARYDGTWSAMADGQGPNSAVMGLHTWNGDLVAGGSFTQIGDVQGSMVARWDGSAWHPLGTGVPYGFGGNVSSLATFEGDLIVGGAFTTAGGIAANKIARWNGTSWSAMGAGSGATVSGLLALGGELYANGYWGGVQTLGRWNGSDFTPLGTAISGSVQILYGLGSFQGDPVMGGSFTSVSGVSAANIARWNGAAWQPLGAGTSGSVFGIHELGADLYVGGTFQQAGGQPASNVARWDGSAWHALGAGVNGRVFGVTSLGGDIYVTGEFTQAGGQPAAQIARWDGAAWHGLGSGLDDDGAAVAVWNGQLFVGGDFTRAGTSGAAHLANWTVAASPVPVGDERAARIFMGPGRPNPFTGSTTLVFSLPAAADVTADVFDVRGAKVRTIARQGMPAGRQSITWDGRDEAGVPAASGVYFVTLRDGVSAARQRVLLVR